VSKSTVSRSHSAWRRLAEAVALVGISLLLASVGGELLLRFLRPQIFDIHPPGMYTEDPVLGYTLTPNFTGTIQRSEFTVPVRVGKGGLRSWEGGPKAADTFRILVLGDSQAFGFGVGDDQTFAAQLERLLAERHPGVSIEVINGGIPGYGTADQVAFLRARGAEIDPDLIVLQFLSVNDLKENRYPATTWAKIENGMLTAKQVDTSPEELVDVIWRWHRYLKLHSHLLRLLSDSVGYLTIRLGWSGSQDSLWGEDFTDEDAALGRSLLVEVAELGRELGADTLFLYTTGQAQVLDGTVDGLRSLEVVEAAAEASGATCIDVGTAMSRRSDRLDLYYRKDGHWTPQGHRAVAEIVIAHLEAARNTFEPGPGASFQAEDSDRVVN
jgi:hypothetical protein